MKSTFTPDITHYFTDTKSVHGADTLANLWREYNLGDRRRVWTVDHGIDDGDEAVIEWTLVVTFLDDDHRKCCVARNDIIFVMARLLKFAPIIIGHQINVGAN